MTPRNFNAAELDEMRKIWHQLVDRLDRLQENERNDPYEQTRNCAGADLPG